MRKMAKSQKSLPDRVLEAQKSIYIEQCYCAEMISIYVMHSILILFVIVDRP